jgi:arginyl-tRNA synthetase
MDIYKSIMKKVVDAATTAVSLDKQHGIPFNAISIDIPSDTLHGEIATNVALVLAKFVNQPPRTVANLISETLRQDPCFKEVTIAGPGFINMVLAPQHWQDELLNILEERASYGKSDVGQGVRVNIEFVSANPTGPVHIGHSRNAVYGSALASLLEHVGFNITREFYVNDAGNQIQIFVNSIHTRYLELCGLYKDAFPQEYYPGEYVIEMAKVLRSEHGDQLVDIENEQTYSTIRNFALKFIIDSIKASLNSLGVTHDIYFYESTLHSNQIEAVVNYLSEHGLVYKGILPKPKDDSITDWEEREQSLVRTTNYGDSMDRALQKSNGEWTYFAADIAYLQDKLNRGFKRLILLIGHDHIGYQKRLEAVCKALNNGENILEVKLCQLVTLLQDGKPFKMSKRAGTFVTVDQMLEMVGKDILRFVMLMRKNDAPLEIDIVKVKEQSKDNPVFYVQYANARANSVLENARMQMPIALEQMEQGQLDLSMLNTHDELELIRWLSYFPRQVETAALRYEPHLIVFYLQRIAALFHAFWNKGKDSLELRFIVQSDQPLTTARLALVKATSIIISNGLELIGVTPVTSM